MLLKTFHSNTGMIGEWTQVTGLRCKRNMYNKFLTSSQYLSTCQAGNIGRKYW